MPIFELESVLVLIKTDAVASNPTSWLGIDHKIDAQSSILDCDASDHIIKLGPGVDLHWLLRLWVCPQCLREKFRNIPQLCLCWIFCCSSGGGIQTI